MTRDEQTLRQLAEVTAECDDLRQQLVTAEADMQACYRRHGEVLSLAEERLAWAHQLQADIEAEQQGRLALRQRFGARDDETMAMWIERLAAERDTLNESLKERRRQVELLAYELRKWQTGEYVDTRLEAERDALKRRVAALEAEVSSLQTCDREDLL